MLVVPAFGDVRLSKFADAAKIIDPTIKGVWVGREPDGEQTPMYVYLERNGSPFKRPLPEGDDGQ